MVNGTYAQRISITFIRIQVARRCPRSLQKFLQPCEELGILGGIVRCGLRRLGFRGFRLGFHSLKGLRPLLGAGVSTGGVDVVLGSGTWRDFPNHSPQCWRKNFFSWVRNSSERPRMGRSEVVIWRVTNRNTMLQMTTGPV